jgi:hypothetical protein
MKPSTRKRVIHAIEKRIEKILKNPLPRAEDLVDVKDKLSREALRTGSFEIGLSAGLRSELESAIRRRPEPTRQELNNFLKEIESLDADSLLRPSLKQVARKLPPFPPGKRPTLNPMQQKKALAEVARLSSRLALSRKEAYRRVAKKYGVHWRTIQNLSIKTNR